MRLEDDININYPIGPQSEEWKRKYGDKLSSKLQEGDRVYIPKENRYGKIIEYDESDNSYGVWFRVPGKSYGVVRFYNESSLEKAEDDD